jgi:hypothetical protein
MDGLAPAFPAGLPDFSLVTNGDGDGRPPPPLPPSSLAWRVAGRGCAHRFAAARSGSSGRGAVDIDGHSDDIWSGAIFATLLRYYDC